MMYHCDCVCVSIYSMNFANFPCFYLPNDLNHLGNFDEPSPEVDALDAVLKLDDEFGLRDCCDVDGLFWLLDV